MTSSIFHINVFKIIYKSEMSNSACKMLLTISLQIALMWTNKQNTKNYFQCKDTSGQKRKQQACSNRNSNWQRVVWQARESNHFARQTTQCGFIEEQTNIVMSSNAKGYLRKSGKNNNIISDLQTTEDDNGAASATRTSNACWCKGDDDIKLQRDNTTNNNVSITRSINH